MAQYYCHDGPAPPITTTTTSECPTSTPEPLGVAGQTIPAPLLDKFNEASKLASIAYCINGSNIDGAIQCDRFCCDFSDMILEDVDILFLIKILGGFLVVPIQFFDPSLLQGLKGFIGRDENPTNKRTVPSLFSLYNLELPLTYQSYLLSRNKLPGSK